MFKVILLAVFIQTGESQIATIDSYSNVNDCTERAKVEQYKVKIKPNNLIDVRVVCIKE